MLRSVPLQTQKTSPAFVLTLSVIISLLVHGVVLAVLSFRPEKEREPVSRPPEKEKVVTVALVVPPAVQPVIPPIPQPRPPAQEKPAEKKESKHFVRTSADQAGPAEETNLLGEHETRASSEAAPTAGAEARPAQDGEESIFPDAIETVNKDYSDGKLDQSIAQPVATTPPPLPPSPQQPDIEEAEQEQEERKERKAADAREAQEEAEKQDRVKERNAALKLQDQAPPETREKVDKRDKVEPVKAQPPKKARTSIANDPAFSGFAKKNKVIGSIGKNADRSAQNVKTGPLAKYQAAMSKAIEREWQRQALRYSDLIVPGVLTVSFFVDHDGRVLRIVFLKEIAGGSVQKGFTYRAIKDAKLPKMPKSVVKELNGDPLEVTYNFGF